MLHMHKKLRRLYQFGGHIELHETPWQAIIREICEESGYDISQLAVLQPNYRLTALGAVTLHPLPMTVQTHKFDGENHFHTDLAFAFITGQKPKFAIGAGESSDIRLCSYSQLNNLSADAIKDNVKQTAMFALDHCLANWEPVETNSFA